MYIHLVSREPGRWWITMAHFRKFPPATVPHSPFSSTLSSHHILTPHHHHPPSNFYNVRIRMLVKSRYPLHESQTVMKSKVKWTKRSKKMLKFTLTFSFHWHANEYGPQLAELLSHNKYICIYTYIFILSIISFITQKLADASDSINYTRSFLRLQ